MEDCLFDRDLKKREEAIDGLLHMDTTFDILKRQVIIGGKEAVFYVVDGFLKGETMEKMMEFFYTIKPEDMPGDFEGFLKQCIPFADLTVVSTKEDFIHYLLSGLTCMCVDGFSQIVAIDLRIYPSRSVAEPDQDKVLRGSRDGFVETIMANIALIRRRIRDVNLMFEIAKVGRSSRTDVSVIYMKDRVDPGALKKVQQTLQEIDVDSLTLNQESLAEVMLKKNWWNPYPKFKYTERPDAAAACLLEGSIVILVDNSPSAMIVPTSLLDIVEDTNDYYLPPVTGTYLRLSRMITSITAIFLTPVYLLMLNYPQWVPDFLGFTLVEGEMNVPPLLQLLILELAIDGLRMAAVNTPNMLNTPLSIVAGIVFGDYTVDSGWFNSEIMLYMAFVAVANYTQNNMELGYAIKFQRIILLILTGFFGIWGFTIGTVLLILALITNKTIAGKGYLYPLVPFNPHQLKKRFLRMSLYHDENS